MSVQTQLKRITVPQIRAHKGGKPIVCLTCYHAHTARLLDPHVDIMLVGDSLGMVMHGLENTLGVTLEMMITHAKAVMRGSSRALVAVDMPFGSYEESPATAFRNAARVIQETGATAVKLEGGTRMAADHPLSHRARHSGDRPYRADAADGQCEGRLPHHRAAPRRNGRTCWPTPRRYRMAAPSPWCWKAWPSRWPPRSPATSRSPPSASAPVAACDGQVLVMEDMLGLNPNPPKFVRQYAQLGPAIEAAVAGLCQGRARTALPGGGKCLSHEEGPVESRLLGAIVTSARIAREPRAG